MSIRRTRRILFFLNSGVHGGVEEVVLSLLRGLPRDRFEPHLAAPQPLLDVFAKHLEPLNVTTLPIELRSWRQWREIWMLFAYLRRHQIEIVNSHLFYATCFAAPIARLAGVPCVIETTHGPESWRSSWWKRHCFVDRCIELFVSLNIAVSEANRGYLELTKRYPVHKLRVVPNGRDLSQYTEAPEESVQQLRRHFGIEAHDRVAVVVGRLEEQKGHRYLLEALPSVTSACPDFRVVLVGEGSLRPELEDRVAALGMERSVIFAGHRADVTLFYALADFVILPSLYEGMPLVAIEAAAAGRALIATAVDGTMEVVIPGVTGLLVPKQSTEALTEAIQDLLDHPHTAQALGRAARRRAETLFSVERQVQETSRLFEEFAPARS
jgi:glycosyltransferase involved in cell wall biosynthesis